MPGSATARRLGGWWPVICQLHPSGSDSDSLCRGKAGHLVAPPSHPTLEHAAPAAAWGACMLALEVMLMGDFNYISLLPPFLASSPTAYEICCYLTSALGWLLLEGDRTGGKEAKASLQWLEAEKTAITYLQRHKQT
ncbi:hypothetical protein F7725_003162 [Dissostichus mawsoni]|uniref:Uncharacterized protein n=1 Tax=Dissostichus mawsoni TaxID=36200 RepID=A0A7J5Y9J0_DISMA|nr:hypothetical protein F7725_003162 [Dissostichus mawsoni]